MAAAPKPAYFVINHKVTDPERLAKYKATVKATFEGFDFDLLSAGQPVTSYEGKAPEGRFVLLRFNGGAAEADRWYNSPAYQAIIKDRTEATETFTFARFDGL